MLSVFSPIKFSMDELMLLHGGLVIDQYIKKSTQILRLMYLQQT